VVLHAEGHELGQTHDAHGPTICRHPHHAALDRQTLHTLVGEYHGLAVTLTHGGLQWQTCRGGAGGLAMRYQECISGQVRGGTAWRRLLLLGKQVAGVRGGAEEEGMDGGGRQRSQVMMGATTAGWLAGWVGKGRLEGGRAGEQHGVCVC
jgi:hypothetical protein